MLPLTCVEPCFKSARIRCAVKTDDDMLIGHKVGVPRDGDIVHTLKPRSVASRARSSIHTTDPQARDPSSKHKIIASPSGKASSSSHRLRREVMKVKYGLMPLLEWHKPMESLKLAVEAEKIGFDSVWADDHFMPAPPLTESTFAWTWMSSALQATEKIFFSTAVTAPVMRYNPAVVAQAFATMGVMYPGRVGIGPVPGKS